MTRWETRVVLAVAVRPRLWRAAYAFVPPGWWKRWPPTLRPPAEFIEFRLTTAYGDPNHEPPVEEILTFLRWAAALRRTQRRSG